MNGPRNQSEICSRPFENTQCPGTAKLIVPDGTLSEKNGHLHNAKCHSLTESDDLSLAKLKHFGIEIFEP